MLDAIGRAVADIGGSLVLLAQLFGALTMAIAGTIARPARLRLTSTVHHLERVGWRAVPIILLSTFLIGAIIAQQGIFHFRTFGAEVFVVDMVGILVLREVGVLIVCVMVAGRSGSAYTAELGAMKMREEIDALRTMGLDPVEVLVLPRIVALVIAVPLLTFLGSMAALYGAGLVCWLYGGMTPEIFLERLRQAIWMPTFAVGMIKAPFMALTIGLVACVEGFNVEGSAASLGPQDHRFGGQIDLPRHRARRVLRHVLRRDRDVKMTGNEAVISVRDLVVSFGAATVLDRVTLDVFRGEILGFVGGSGAGKSVLMRTIIGLLPKRAGTIEVFGSDLASLDGRERRAVERRWGVLFQQGALFSSLTVRQNVQFPMREHLDLSPRLIDEIALAKLEMVGLDPAVAEKFPAELSGGMTKRVALARALALDPDIVFLDEPTSGLDPVGAAAFDELIRTLQRTLGLSVFMVTHDLDSLHAVCDRIAVLVDGRVIAAGPIEAMLASEHQWLKSYFRGKRGRQVYH